MKKKALVIRLGAIGDCLVVTPVIKYLKQQGWDIVFNTSDTGMEVLKNNPYIDEWVYYPNDSVPPERLMEYFRNIYKKHNCTKMFNFTESLEVAICLHPSSPEYNWTKEERRKLCDQNYYEWTFKYVGIDPQVVMAEEIDLVPDLHFTKEEESKMQEELKDYQDNFKILLSISGSGLNKIYPYWEDIFNGVYKEYKSIKVFTVGDENCRLIEWGEDKDYVVEKSGKWSIRESMLSTKYMDLVCGTDTGITHASGCYDTPKIVVLGHSTPENITKHFRGKVINLCSNVSCAPCFRLIYNSQVQCPRFEPIGTGCLCMTGQWDYKTGEFKAGINPEVVKEKIIEVITSGRS